MNNTKIDDSRSHRSKSVEIGERLCLSISEAAAMIGISRNNAYELVRRGKLPVIELGKRKLIPKVQLMNMLEGGGNNERPHSQEIGK